MPVENGSRLRIDITQPKELLGWIFVTFKTEGSEVTIDFSDATGDFGIIDLFRALEKNFLPREIEIDEEGKVKVIRLLPVEKDQVRLQIQDYDYGEPDPELPDYPKMYIDAVFDRTALIKEFFTKCADFLENGFNPEMWRETNLKAFYSKAIKSITQALNKEPNSE